MWSVIRIDDNGNTFVVKSNLTRPEAMALCNQLTNRGHKQVYLVSRKPGAIPKMTDRLATNIEAMLLELEPKIRRLNELKQSPNFLDTEEEAQEVLDTLNFWLETINKILSRKEWL